MQQGFRRLAGMGCRAQRGRKAQGLVLRSLLPNTHPGIPGRSSSAGRGVCPTSAGVLSRPLRLLTSCNTGDPSLGGLVPLATRAELGAPRDGLCPPSCRLPLRLGQVFVVYVPWVWSWRRGRSYFSKGPRGRAALQEPGGWPDVSPGVGCLIRQHARTAPLGRNSIAGVGQGLDSRDPVPSGVRTGEMLLPEPGSWGEGELGVACENGVPRSRHPGSWALLGD